MLLKYFLILYIIYLKNVSDISVFTLSLINSYYYYLNKNINENNKVSDDNINTLIKIDRKNNKKKPFIKGRKDKNSTKKKKNNDLSLKDDKKSSSSHINLKGVEQNNKKSMEVLISIKHKIECIIINI